jgi:hypothetical protein
MAGATEITDNTVKQTIRQRMKWFLQSWPERFHPNDSGRALHEEETLDSQ